MLAKLPVQRQAMLDAADLIETHGLAKDAFQCGDALCVRGAIRAAINEDKDPFTGQPEAELFFTEYLISKKKLVTSEFYSHHPYHLHGACAEWNNEEDRTQEEVVTSLREAALEGL